MPRCEQAESTVETGRISSGEQLFRIGSAAFTSQFLWKTKVQFQFAVLRACDARRASVRDFTPGNQDFCGIERLVGGRCRRLITGLWVRGSYRGSGSRPACSRSSVSPDVRDPCSSTSFQTRFCPTMRHRPESKYQVPAQRQSKAHGRLEEAPVCPG